MKNSWRSAIGLDLLSRSSRGSLMSLMLMMEVLEVRALREVLGFLVCGVPVPISGTSSDVVGETTMMLSTEVELWIE